MSVKEITDEGRFASFATEGRSSNWIMLNRMAKTLYTASLWHTKHISGIVNGTLVEKLLVLVEWLEEMMDMRLSKKGFDDAVQMHGKRDVGVVFAGAIWLTEVLAKRSGLYLLTRDGVV